MHAILVDHEVGGRTHGDAEKAGEESGEDSGADADANEEQPVFVAPGSKNAVVQPAHWHQFEEATYFTCQATCVMCDMSHTYMVNAAEYHFHLLS